MVSNLWSNYYYYHHYDNEAKSDSNLDKLRGRQHILTKCIISIIIIDVVVVIVVQQRVNVDKQETRSEKEEKGNFLALKR